MNERKPGRAGNPQDGAAGPDSIQQRRIGDILQRVYDEVLRQGVPDRFKDLLHQFDRAEEDGEAATAAQRQGEGHHETDRLVGAKAFDNKGSRS